MRLPRVLLCLALIARAGLMSCDAQAANSSWDLPSLQLLLTGRVSALGYRATPYELMYREPHILGDFGLEISYFNEGRIIGGLQEWLATHTVPVHNRDGFSLQLDRWTPLFYRCRVGVAAGVENDFDTTTDFWRVRFEDRHSIGARVALNGQCYLFATLALDVVVGRSLDPTGYDATFMMAGFTLVPRVRDVSAGTATWEARPDYIELAGGKLQVDSLHTGSDRGMAQWLTYGHAMRKPFAVEIFVLNEVSGGVMQRRRSVGSELVASRSFAVPALQLFAGVGPSVGRTDILDNRQCTDFQPACSLRQLRAYRQMSFHYSYGFRLAIGTMTSVVVRIGRVESASGASDSGLLTAGVAVALR